jgi:hypothetical protein
VNASLVTENQAQFAVYGWKPDTHPVPGRDAEHDSRGVRFHIGVDRPTVIEFNGVDAIVSMCRDRPGECCIVLIHGGKEGTLQLLDCELGGLTFDRQPPKRHARGLTLTIRN